MFLRIKEKTVIDREGGYSWKATNQWFDFRKKIIQLFFIYLLLGSGMSPSKL